MSVIASIRAQLVPIHREGYPFIAVFALAAVVLFLLWPPLGTLGTLATLWVVYFFRDPPRVTPVADALVVAPADGRISLISRAVPPAELALGAAPLPRISIFMSVFDCHVNRSPVTGRIERMVYRAGKFLNADLDKASEDNERNALVIDAAGTRIGLVQIAGLIARRIVPFVREGDAIGAGERIGMIRFGSRVDLYLPDDARLRVGQGQIASTSTCRTTPGSGSARARSRSPARRCLPSSARAGGRRPTGRAETGGGAPIPLGVFVKPVPHHAGSGRRMPEPTSDQPHAVGEDLRPAQHSN